MKNKELSAEQIKKLQALSKVFTDENLQVFYNWLKLNNIVYTGELEDFLRKQNESFLYPHDMIYKALTRFETNKALTINRKNKSTIQWALKTATDNAIIEKPLSYNEQAVLTAVFNIIDRLYFKENELKKKQKWEFTDLQVFREMRGNPKSNPSTGALMEIRKIILNLNTIKYVAISNDEKSKKILGTECSSGTLLNVEGTTTKKNGKFTDWNYKILGYENDGVFEYRPKLLRLIRKNNQFQYYDKKLLAVKNKNGKVFNLDGERISILYRLLEFALNYVHAREGGSLKCSNKITFALIFDECNIDFTTGSNSKRKRLEDFIVNVFYYWRGLGFINFEIYKNKNQQMGIELKYIPKKSRELS